MLMKNKFLSKSVPRGTRTIWRYLGALFLLFTLSIGQMWGVTATPTPAGTYAIGNSKAGGQYRFLPMLSGSVYNYRMNNSSYGDAGMKLKGNDNAVIVYLGSSMDLTVTCTLNKDNKGEDAAFTVYTIAKTSFDEIISKENQYSSDGSSRTVQISTTGTQASFTVEIPNNVTKGTFTGSPASALPAGYYYIVGSTPSDGNGNVYFTSITLAAGSGGGDTTAPTLSSSVPANSATGVAVEGTIVLTFSEAIATVDGSKFTLTGATKGTVAIDGTDSKKVNVPYTGAANEATVTLKVAAEAVADAAGNKSAALDDISFTTVAAVTPVCPSGISISGTNAYTEGQTISLSAALTEGNGTISYQWYKGSIASGNEVGTGATFTKSNCATGDAANYYCVASKDGCSNAVSSAYAVTVEEKTCPTSGVLYTMTMKSKSLSSVTQNTEVALVAGDYATENGGVSYLGNNNSDASKAQIKTEAGGIVYFNGNDAYLKVALDCPLQPGDLITIEGNASSTELKYLITNTNSRSSYVTSTNTTGTKKYYTVVADDILDGKSNVYFWREVSSGNKNIHSITITRPYAITFSSAKGSAPSATTGFEVTLEEITGVEGWVHTGWTADAAVKVGSTDKAAGAALDVDATVTVSSDVTFTATWEADVTKYTVSYYNGEAIEANKLGSELINEGSNPTGAGLAPTKHGYTFGGWSLTNGGAAVVLNTISVVKDTSLFVVWTPIVCPTGGTVFSAVANPSKAPSSDYKIAGNSRADLATYATISGGTALFGNANSDQSVTIKSSTSKIAFSGSNMRGYVKVTMDCDLKVGDIIRIADNSNKFRIAFDSTATDKVDVSNGNHDVVIDAAHKDKYEFFIYRNGNDVNFGSIQVLRPYTVSFNLNGQSATAIADQKVLAGEKVTKPTDPEVTGQAFGGWFTNEACTSGNEWAFATATVSQDTTLYAKWTALKSMTLNAGTGTGDDIVSYPTVGDPVAVPACPATFEKSGYNFAGWAYSPSVEVENGQFTMPDANLTLTAQWEDANTVAKIGAASYTSLKDALTAATTGQTITMVANHTVDASTKISLSGKVVTLDLNGKTVTVNRTGSGGAWWVSTGATLNLVDNTVTENFTRADVEAGTYAGGKLLFNNTEDAGKTGQLFTVEMGGVLNFNSGWYESNTCLAAVFDDDTELNVTSNKAVLISHNDGVIMGNGNAGWGGYTIGISGGILYSKVEGEGDGCVIYHPNEGGLNISGGLLVAANGPAIVVRGGNTNVTGGTIEANGTGDYKMGDAAQLVPAVGIVYDFKSEYPAGSIASTISAGTITSVSAIYVDAEPTTTEEASIAVSGGTFTEPVAEALCADGYVPETKANGKYGVIVPAQSIDFEAIIDALGTDDEGKAELDAQLAAKHYDIDGTLNDDRLDPGSSKVADKGFKVKKTDLTISFSVEAGKMVEITTGSLSGASIKVNDAAAVAMTASHTHMYYSGDAQAFLITMTAASNKYNIFKSINIHNPYQVSFNNEGTTIDPMPFTGEGLTLPTVTGLGNAKRFDHWCTSDAKTTPVALDANGKFWPTSDTTLHAAYKTLYELSFNGNGADIVSSMDPLYYAAGDEVAVPACTFEKTDLTFAGWTYSPSVTVENGKFSMPSSTLVLTATWEDLSKVVKVVREDYEQSYDNFLDARNDVRDNGGTIILLQDLEESLYYGIAADITIDLNGHRLASNDGNDLFLVYDGGKLTINGTTTGSKFHGRINVGSNAGSDGTLILNGGTYTCASGNTCIHVHGESDASVVTINGASITSPDDNGVQFNGYGTFTVTDATITGGTGIYIKSGVLTITNSTVTGTLTPQNYSYYGNGAYPTGDGIVVDACNYPGGAPTINIISGTFTGTKGAVGSYNYQGTSEPAIGGIQGGSFSSRVPSDLCAPGLVPSEENPETHMYTVEPKEPICIIKSTPTSGTEASVDGVLKGSAFFTGRENDKKLNSKYHNVGVQLKEGYTFLATDKVVLNQTADLGTDDLKKFYVFYEEPADGKTYATILNASPVKGDNWFDMPEEIVGKSSLYVGRVDANCNPSVGYLAVYRVSAPILNKVTVAGVDGTPDAQNKVAIELPFTTTDAAFEAIAYDWVSNNDAWTADPANAPVAANAWEWGVENTVTFTDKDGDESEYYITISKAAVSSDATLATLTYGTPATAIALAEGVYEYNVELPYGTSAVPALAATTNHAGASVTDIDDADAFVNRHATSTVTVTAEDGTTTQLYTVNFTVSRFESKVLWDGSTMTQMSDITAAATAAGVSITTTGIGVTSFSAMTCEENGKSYTKALDFGGKTKSDRYFGIEVPAGKVAKVSLVYRAKGTGRSIMVATALSSVVDESTITSKEAVDGSNLYIMTADMFGGGTLYINTTDGYHVHEISIQLADGHARSAMLGAGVFGTVCVPNNVAVEDIQGVTVYELMGREPQYGKLAFDEIVSGELEAGVPYVFQAHRNHMALLYGTEHKDDPVNKGNGMYGTFTSITLTELADVYYFAQRALWSCVDLSSLSVPANRAYVKLSEIDYINSEPAPGRKRVTMAVNGEQVATGVENAETIQEGVQKIMIDGQLFILRGEKMYDATGRLVK